MNNIENKLLKDSDDKFNTESEADNFFHSNKKEAKTDFDLACELYRNYVGSAKTIEERMRRIREFRCG